MAPTFPVDYIPSLDRCLDGHEPVIPWHAVREALCSTDAAITSLPTLEHFLCNEHTSRVLVNSISAPSGPNATAKADFETRTAAINVSPSQAGRHNMQDIKDDAGWLSQTAEIDQVSALRVVVLECQQRSARRLTSQWSAEEIATLHRATSAGNAASLSSLNLPLAAPVDPGRLTDHDSAESRRARQMEIFLTERADTLVVLELLLCLQVSPRPCPPGIRNVARTVCKRLDDMGPRSSTFTQCVDAAKDRLRTLSDSSKWPSTVAEDAALTFTYHNTLLSELVTTLRLALLSADRSTGLSSEPHAMLWFTFMDQTNFLSDLTVGRPSQESLVNTCQSLATVVSLAVLNVPDSLYHLQENLGSADRPVYPDLSRKPYLESEACIGLLTNCLLGAASYDLTHVGPVVLAWSVITQVLREGALEIENDTRRSTDDTVLEPDLSLSRRSSLRNSVSRTSRLGALLGQVLDAVPGEDPIALMGNAAISQMRAFDAMSAVVGILSTANDTSTDLYLATRSRQLFMALLREVLPLVTYGPDIVGALITVLSYDKISRRPASSDSWPSEPALALLDDADVMGPRLIDQILKRYPYELGPFASCLNALSKSVASVDQGESRIMLLLEDLSTFTMVMPADFQAYELLQEDEMVNCIRLTQHIPIFKAKQQASEYASHASTDHTLTLLPGTVGMIINDARPFVVCWRHSHSAFEYLGCLLGTRLANAQLVDASSAAPVDSETATDIIVLFTSILDSLTASGNTATARQLLGRMSNGLMRNDDIIRVVFEAFESELQLHSQQNVEVSLAYLEASVNFMCVAVKLCPDRVWSFLSRSRLLASTDDTNNLAAIVNTSELTLATYPFLSSCTRLFSALIESAMSESVSKTSSVSKSVTRFVQSMPPAGAISEKNTAMVVLAFQRIYTDMFRGLVGWRFNDPDEKIMLQSTILLSHASILDCAFGIDNADEATPTISSVFKPAADALLNTFTTNDELAFQSFLDIFANVTTSQISADDSEQSKAQSTLTTTAIELCTSLLYATQLTGRDASALIDRLLQAMPLLIRLYASSTSYDIPMTNLITSLVLALNHSRQVPPSLLVNVSPEAAKLFVSILSHHKRPLASAESEVRMWHMLSVIVSNKQQWLAICLLTGNTPKDRLSKTQSDKESSSNNLLLTALNELAELDSVSPRCAKNMLAFVANAQNHWPWATDTIKTHGSFITAITNWVADMKPYSRPTDPEVATRFAHENQMAGSVADILATYLHSASQAEAEKLISKITPKLEFLRDHGTEVGGYNFSLHQNLAKNFVQNLAGCSLESFKRSALHPADYGKEYYYDLGFATKILGFHPAWDRQNGQGFVDELARASVNLALLDSEIVLLKQWKGLAIEIASRTAHQPDRQRDVAMIVEGCLRANIEVTLPTGLCDDLPRHRVDLAFALLQRLVLAKATAEKARGLVLSAWDLVRSYGQDFEGISTPQDADYYRLLLRILYLALQLQTQSNGKKGSGSDGKLTKASKTSTLENVLLEVLDKVVAVNFRALCSSVHEDASTVDPSDFVLITAITQSILGIKELQVMYRQIATVVSDKSLIKYATSLYSWSHSLSSPDQTDDPIYGLYAILFLLSLSTIPLCAEEMATSCLLSHLTSAATSIRYFRNPPNGSGPLDHPLRAHDIWTRGILPLSLNLLSAVGPALAAEVGNFLNSFPNQLRRLERDLGPNSFSAPERPVTLGLASEAHSLALIGRVLNNLRGAGASVETAGLRPYEIPTLAIDRAVLAEEIMALVGGSSTRSSAPPAGLRDRIVPVGAREVEWSRLPARADLAADKSAGYTLLEERVVGELRGAADCLE